MPIPGSFWGGMFPERPSGDVTFFAGHFPEVVEAPASMPATIGALILESGSTMTIRWPTGIAYSLIDKERRSNLHDDPILEFTGTALVASSTVLANRSLLAQHAANGEPFSLGLPWEGITVDDEAAGNVLFVPTTVNVDWVAIGVRVLVTHPENGVLESFITAFTADSITLNDAPGDVGDLGADIMPVIQVLLDPQQTFARFTGELDVERWDIKATAAVAGIVAAAAYAKLALVDVAGSGVLDTVVLIAPLIGSAGNALSVQFIGDAVESDYASISGNRLTYHFIPGVTTVGGAIGRIERTDFFVVTGDRTTDVITLADEFGPTNLAGGLDQLPVEMGQGATLTAFAGRPIWDRPINTPSTAQDSIQTRAPLVELGAKSFAAANGPTAAWGRQISLNREIFEQWQWVKKFLWTVCGSWRTFWLPTWRNDLRWLESNAGTITVESGAAAGDFFTWYPRLRDHLRIQQDTTETYVRISAAVDNGDGTITLNIVDENDNAVTLSADDVDRLSWLELTRFSSDAQAPQFTKAKVELNTTGRVVQQ
jgi:hypothetical protein